jgi:DNA-directed RNA polymerase specialized sigma24 family protein
MSQDGSMQITCAVCGDSFEAKPSAKYCGDRCRKRAQRQPDTEKPEKPKDRPAEVDFPIGLVASTLTELAKAGRETSPAGQAALLLAYRLERSHADTGSSVAAMVKQHQETLAAALKTAERASVVDELKKRRDEKRAG